ncbi:MAG: IS5 family transposase [Methanomassiliicoccaceae archaeon]|nr:IS5 family transposase [Methanomassiliicoccaceae archaeon]
MYRRRSAQRADKLAKIIIVVSMALIAAGVPRYSSHFSNHVYDDHAKIGMLVLRQHLDVSYEELMDAMGSMKGVMKALRIRNIPDPSTLRKFVKRLDPNVLDRVLWHTAKAVCNDELTVAIDATGLYCSNASRHYERRIREFKDGKVAYSGAPVRGYEKMTLAVDTGTCAILAADSCASNTADVKRLPFVVDDMREAEYNVRCVLADKGYDSEQAHRYVRENLQCETFIPMRRKSEPAKTNSSRTRTSGFYRGLMKFFFDPVTYRRRSIVETVNSMFKRKMSDIVYGRTPWARSVEVLCRCIAHNIRRMFSLGVKV